MDWYAKSVRRMRDPDYLRLPADLRGHHDALLALLAERERGPVLHGARQWSRRDWDRACAATLGAVTRLVEVGLATWSGDDLVVTDYDERGESLLRQKRKAGGKGAEERWSRHGTANGGASAAAMESASRAANAQDGTGRDGTDRTSESGEAPAFSLTHPESPRPSPVTTLRDAWLAWFLGRYGEAYYWRGRDADDAVELLKLAGERGVDEVMRRARALGSPKREKSITPAILRLAWNEVAARPAPPAPPKGDPLLDGMANGTIP